MVVPDLRVSLSSQRASVLCTVMVLFFTSAPCPVVICTSPVSRFLRDDDPLRRLLPLHVPVSEPSDVALFIYLSIPRSEVLLVRSNIGNVLSRRAGLALFLLSLPFPGQRGVRRRSHLGGDTSEEGGGGGRVCVRETKTHQLAGLTG